MIWSVDDAGMLNPNVGQAIPYFILHRPGTPERITMVLCTDAPTDSARLYGLRVLADEEYAAVTGMWAGQLVDAIDSGRMTFDLVFADELVDTRKKV